MRRGLLALGALSLAVVLFFLFRPDGDDDRTVTTSATTTQATTTTAPLEPEPVRVVFRDGRVRGGVQTYSFQEGDQIRLTVRADVADHVHVHGYDLMKDVSPGKTVTFSFPAEITGIFEIELEDRGEEIAQLRVDP